MTRFLPTQIGQAKVTDTITRIHTGMEIETGTTGIIMVKVVITGQTAGATIDKT
jgi:hypothetical protein